MRQQHECLRHPFRLLATFSSALNRLLVADVLIRFCEQIPYAYVVIWCMRPVPGYKTALVTATDFGFLTTIEMVVAILCYLPVAKYADKGSKKPFVVITFINFALFPLILLYSRSFAWLVIAFVVRGMKEFGEPTAPENRKAAAFGAYYLVRDSIVSLAAFGGAFLWTLEPAANFPCAFAFGILGALWFSLAGRDNSRLAPLQL